MIYATAHKKARSAAEDKRNFDKHCKALAGRRLGTIKKADIQKLHTTIGADGGPYAANRTLALLKSMFNKAEELGYRGDNPCRRVKKFAEVARDRFLQAGEAEAFFDALQGEAEVFRDFFLMSLLTGARKGQRPFDEVDRPGPVGRLLADPGNEKRVGGCRAPCRSGRGDPGEPPQERQRLPVGIPRPPPRRSSSSPERFVGANSKGRQTGESPARMTYAAVSVLGWQGRTSA